MIALNEAKLKNLTERLRYITLEVDILVGRKEAKQGRLATKTEIVLSKGV